MKPVRGFVCSAALAGLLLLLPSAQSEEPPRQQRLQQPRTTFSSSRRFVVEGLPMARATEVAQWAEGVADRVTSRLGAIPFGPGETLVIEGSNVAGLEPLIHAGQGCREGVIWQKLTLRNLEQLDAEQADEMLGNLLISRFIQALQDPSARCLAPGRAPDWMVVGLIHNSSTELRARDRGSAFRRWSVDEMEPLSDLLGRFFMPPGRWPEKADATLLVAWLVDSSRGVALLGDALRAQAQGQTPDGAWWAMRMIGAPDIARAEREWDLWIAEQQERSRVWSAGDARALANIHRIPLSALEAAGGPPELADLPLSEMIGRRHEPWVRSLAVRLALRYRLETIGLEEEAVNLAKQYARFLDALASQKSARALRAEWKVAEERRVSFEAMVDARRRYLDSLEARVRPEDVNAAAARRFLDAIEARDEKR
ncbi:MAG: hypothetical protein M9963_02230 [Kiritimatiellae bacterium]|nr:hypothetical protein [Kiritimatiellia bacterium]